MEKEEAELGRLNLSMQQAAQDQDGSRITEISQALHACQQTIDRLFAELEKLTRDLDAATPNSKPASSNLMLRHPSLIPEFCRIQTRN